jgi:type I restriction enzyme R subunit
VDGILDRMIFDGEQLSDLMAPLDLGWKARTQAELALMEDLHPLLTKRAALAASFGAQDSERV